MTLFLRMLAWPVAMGLGFAFVVWFYELTDATATMREIDESLWLSQTAWFAAPALSWFLIPAAWGRPRWAVWTLAAGGVAIFAAFGILVGLFVSLSGFERYSDFGPDDFLFLFERIGDQSVEKWIWLPAQTALYLMAPVFGFVIVFGMISRALAAFYLVAGVVGSAVVYFLYAGIWQVVGDLVSPIGGDLWPTSTPLVALIYAAVSGVFCAVGIMAWALAFGPDAEEDGEPW